MQAVALQFSRVLCEQDAIGRQGEVFDAFDARQFGDEVRQSAAQQRFATREAHLAHAESRRDPRQPHDLLERQALLRAQETVLVVERRLRHAVRAAEIAAIHDRDAQVVHRPTELVDHGVQRTEGNDTGGTARLSHVHSPAVQRREVTRWKLAGTRRQFNETIGAEQ